MQTVREKFTCRNCEGIGKRRRRSMSRPLGWAGSAFLATLLLEEYGQPQPLDRQAEWFACEGVPLATLRSPVSPIVRSPGSPSSCHDPGSEMPIAWRHDRRARARVDRVTAEQAGAHGVRLDVQIYRIPAERGGR